MTRDGDQAVTFSTQELAAARCEATFFISKMALRTASTVGFGWEAKFDAPSTYRDLIASVERSERTKQPLPVYDGDANGTIFNTQRANLQLRFWHDIGHVKRQRSFSTPDELDLALWQLAVAKAEGVSSSALALLDADFVGQTLLYAATKQYATNQLRFDLDVVTFGIADAIVLERERQQSV